MWCNVRDACFHGFVRIMHPPVTSCFTPNHRCSYKWRPLCYVRWLDIPETVVATIASVERRTIRAAERVDYLVEMRTAPFAAYRWSRATGSTRSGHPTAGDAHYGVITAESVLYRAPLIPLFRHMPSDPDPTFFLNTDMWDL